MPAKALEKGTMTLVTRQGGRKDHKRKTLLVPENLHAWVWDRINLILKQKYEGEIRKPDSPPHKGGRRTVIGNVKNDLIVQHLFTLRLDLQEKIGALPEPTSEEDLEEITRHARELSELFKLVNLLLWTKVRAGLSVNDARGNLQIDDYWQVAIVEHCCERCGGNHPTPDFGELYMMFGR